MKKSFLTALAVSISMGAVTASADPWRANDCQIEAMSNAARYDCLARKLESLNAQLSASVAGTIKSLPESGLWGDFRDKKDEVGFYERRAKAIKAAHNQWMKYAEAECLVTSGVHEGGSGEDTYAIECRIEKIIERLNYLKSREPYKSFRKNDG